MLLSCRQVLVGPRLQQDACGLVWCLNSCLRQLLHHKVLQTQQVWLQWGGQQCSKQMRHQLNWFRVDKLEMMKAGHIKVHLCKPFAAEWINASDTASKLGVKAWCYGRVSYSAGCVSLHACLQEDAIAILWADLQALLCVWLPIVTISQSICWYSTGTYDDGQDEDGTPCAARNSVVAHR